MFVEKSGYVPTILTDGPKGLEAALAPDSPPIILLDWMLPGMDGIAVCKKIREAKPKVRPYIIILSAKHGKEEIAAGLDAGADDFVSKPFNVAEMQARLRVASRLVEYQRELMKQIEDNEVLSQRNSLLGELISKRQSPDPEEPPVSAKAVPVKAVEQSPTDFSDHEVRYMLSISLLEVRLALQGVTPRPRPPEIPYNEYCGWWGLLAPAHDTWIDLLLLGGGDVTAQLFERSLGRCSMNENETAGFMAELARLVAIGFTRILRPRAGDIVQPLMSRAARLQLSKLPVPLHSSDRSFDLIIENLPFKLILSKEACAKRLLSPPAVQALDVLAGPFPPREISSVPMFNEGVVMTPRFLDKMMTHDLALQQGECVSLRRPSRLARHFNT